MKRNILTLTLSCLIASFSYTQTINTDKSQVKFEISNFSMRTVKGVFSGMKGSVKFSETDLTSSFFDVCIDASTVNTNSRKRDDHLRDKDFFETTTYPSICFKSSSIAKTANGYLAKGSLTMHGVTKEVQIPFTFTNNVFTGLLTVNRLDYNVGAGTGTFIVGNEAKLTIMCTLN